MSFPEICALSRAVARSNPKDRSQQESLLLQIRELRDLFDRAGAPDLVVLLEAAALLTEGLTKPKALARARVQQVVGQLVGIVEEAFSNPGAEEYVPRSKGEEFLVKQTLPAQIDLPNISDMVLGQILVHTGAVSSENIEEAIAVQRATAKRIGEALVQIGATSWDRVQGGIRIQQNLREQHQLDREPETPPERTPTAVGLRRLAPRNENVLGQILLQQELVTEAQIDRALEVQRATGIRIGEALVQLGAIDWDDLKKAVETQRRLQLDAGYGGAERDDRDYRLAL